MITKQKNISDIKTEVSITTVEEGNLESLTCSSSLGPKGDCGALGRPGAQGAKGEKGQLWKTGVKYVRWGRTTCPNGAQIVYKGKGR